MADSSLPVGAKASMEPARVELAYRIAKRGDGRSESTRFLSQGLLFPQNCEDAAMRFSDGIIDVDVGFDGEVLEVALTPVEPVHVESCRIVLRHAFASDELVLLNGYQSWTDTVERPAWSRMRGLRGVPKTIVDKYVLDGGGDYAIVDYTTKRGILHGFTYATFRRGEGLVLVASLDESKGFTLIGTDAAVGEISLETECPLRVVRTGERTVLGRYVIARGRMKYCYDRWFELSGIRARKVKTLVGYTSWYRHYEEIDEKKLLADLKAARAFFDDAVSFDLPGLQKLFQIDDGYCDVGDWLAVNTEKFPNGLKPLADAARDAGFMPGLWVAPFVCGKHSRLFRERSEWLLRDSSGEPVSTGSHWGGAYALDTRNVDVRSYILEVLQTMTREWGFGLLKIDFLYGACMRPHSGLTRGQLMADAVDLVRTGVGENVLLLGCGVPLGSAFGKLDYCRIGCDVGLDWNDSPHMRLLHRERVSTKNSLDNTYARAPLDGRAFGIDPDVFFLRNDVKLTRNQRDELLFANADLGRVLLTSDNMDGWKRASRERYLHALKVAIERSADRS